MKKVQSDGESGTAKILDDAIVYVTCAAYASARKWGPAVPSLMHCVNAYEEERKRRKLPILIAPSELPANWAGTILFPEKGNKYKLAHTRLLSRTEIERKRRWGLVGENVSSASQGFEITIDDAGRQMFKTNFYIQKEKDGRHWVQVNRSWAPPKEQTTFSGKRFKTYSVMTFETSPSDPHLVGPYIWAGIHLWSVDFSMGEESAVIRFITDATGVKGLFDLRDKPEGKSRRDALQHWVRQHTRKIRTDPEMEVNVKQHVRGKTRFDWFGLQGVVNEPTVIPDPLPPLPAKINPYAAAARGES